MSVAKYLAIFVKARHSEALTLALGSAVNKSPNITGSARSDLYDDMIKKCKRRYLAALRTNAPH
jgi:hypothetical protein